MPPPGWCCNQIHARHIILPACHYQDGAVTRSMHDISFCLHATTLNTYEMMIRCAVYFMDTPFLPLRMQAVQTTQAYQAGRFPQHHMNAFLFTAIHQIVGFPFLSNTSDCTCLGQCRPRPSETPECTQDNARSKNDDDDADADAADEHVPLIIGRDTNHGASAQLEWT